ncbi:hypothetical protein [Prochlorococcus marinus]|uniref:Glycosyltransferase RgtA/B/C/D-like domain-containing protein n=1 Tax=Prochlorococcus marinus XMU1408 TaxID=2213228 RepID=A0A318RCC6_PROMR|nr:hypothetical protein [Prochlorococcus marinus]PYE01082.1 hypothetical protein DNJ73_06515 [Prochlorococcus marinus XMU1408]
MTGDEPHYLVIANGISKYHSFEQTKPYQEEFITREIYAPGLNSANKNSIPQPDNTHAVMGPNGLFNVHNIGLPLLLAIPFKISGVQGCKAFMILNGGFIIFSIWNILSLLCPNENIRFLATIPLAISNPLIFASNQIYPELPAASISLIGIYWIVLERKKDLSKINIDWFTFISISFLPWLHIKYLTTLIILLTFMVFILIRYNKNKKRLLYLSIPTILSFLLLFWYNHYAFGNITGPYNQWTKYGNNIEFSWKAITVFFGLLFDQEQGIFLQNPINLLGLISIGLLYKKNKIICLTIALVSLSSIFINSIHPAWYGGYSLIGRFGWTGGIIFMLYAGYFLIWIGLINKKLLILISSISIAIAIHIYKLFTIDSLHLYNLENNPNSSRLYSYLGNQLPSWMEADKVIFHTPNLIFLLLSILLLYSGFIINNIIDKELESEKISINKR